MPSIKDATEEAFQDKFALIKYFVYAIPVFYCVYLYTTNQKDLTAFWYMTSFTFILMLGFLIKCTSNVRNCLDHVLPSYNIFHLLWAGIKGAVALGPVIFVNCWVASFICSSFTIPEPNTDTILKSLICMVFLAIILTSFLLYSKNMKITDTYNLKIISDHSIDILIYTLFFIPLLLLVNAVFIGIPSYICWIIFGLPNTFCTYFWCMGLVFNLAIIGNYMAQIDYERIEAQSNRD